MKSNLYHKVWVSNSTRARPDCFLSHLKADAIGDGFCRGRLEAAWLSQHSHLAPDLNLHSELWYQSELPCLHLMVQSISVYLHYTLTPTILLPCPALWALVGGVWPLRADPGDLLALMGPSGAGKSTLMDILAGRKSVGGNLTGSVLVDGAARKQQAFARKTAYVPQVRGGVGETCWWRGSACSMAR